MMDFIDLAAQQKRIRERIDLAIAGVLDHGRYIMGPEVGRLEAQLAEFVGAGEVVSCASGTDALVMALLVRGVGHGDAVFLPSFTFAATAEAVALLGATPVFVDIDQDTYNMDPVRLAEAIYGLPSGLRGAGVIPVDLFGLPADHRGIASVAVENSLWVIADAAQSFGAEAADVRVGRFAPLTTLSFFPAKPLGCYGDGGAVVALDPADAVVLRSVRVHGAGTDKYDNVRLGINGRLDTVQAAILIEKLAIFGEELELRDAVARRYTGALEGVVATPLAPRSGRSAWAQYTVRVHERKRVVEQLREVGVPTAVYYPVPLHRQRAYSAHPVGAGGLRATDQASAEVLSLPMHPYLRLDDQDRIIDSLRSAVGSVTAS